MPSDQFTCCLLYSSSITQNNVAASTMIWNCFAARVIPSCLHDSIAIVGSTARLINMLCYDFCCAASHCYHSDSSERSFAAGCTLAAPSCCSWHICVARNVGFSSPFPKRSLSKAKAASSTKEVKKSFQASHWELLHSEAAQEYFSREKRE